MTPENGPFSKKKSSSNHQISENMLVFNGVKIPKNNVFLAPSTFKPPKPMEKSKGF